MVRVTRRVEQHVARDPHVEFDVDARFCASPAAINAHLAKILHAVIVRIEPVTCGGNTGCQTERQSRRHRRRNAVLLFQQSFGLAHLSKRQENRLHRTRKSPENRSQGECSRPASDPRRMRCGLLTSVEFLDHPDQPICREGKIKRVSADAAGMPPLSPWQEMTWQEMTWQEMTWQEMTWQEMTWQGVGRSKCRLAVVNRRGLKFRNVRFPPMLRGPNRFHEYPTLSQAALRPPHVCAAGTGRFSGQRR